jgi:hypothetical protein
MEAARTEIARTMLNSEDPLIGTVGTCDWNGASPAAHSVTGGGVGVDRPTVRPRALDPGDGWLAGGDPSEFSKDLRHRTPIAYGGPTPP